MQTPCGQHGIMAYLPFASQRLNLGLLLHLSQVGILAQLIDRLVDPATQHNVGPSTGHIGRNRDGARSTRFGNDFGLACMLLGIKNVVGKRRFDQHLGQQLGVLNAGRAHQHRLTALVTVANVLKDCVVLFFCGSKHLILTINPHHGSMGWNDDGLQVINFLEFIGFGIRGPGHPAELAVHAEVVLKSN